MKIIAVVTVGYDTYESQKDAHYAKEFPGDATITQIINWAKIYNGKATINDIQLCEVDTEGQEFKYEMHYARTDDQIMKEMREQLFKDEETQRELNTGIE